MLRHKAMIQGARLAFGFVGIYDQDEAERIVERDMGFVEEVRSTPTVEMPRAKTEAAAAIEHNEPVTLDLPINRLQPAEEVFVAAQPEPKAEPVKRAEPAPATNGNSPVSPGMLSVLKARMGQAGLGEHNLRAQFDFGFDGVTKANYADVAKWCGNPDT